MHFGKFFFQRESVKRHLIQILKLTSGPKCLLVIGCTNCQSFSSCSTGHSTGVSLFSMGKCVLESRERDLSRNSLRTTSDDASNASKCIKLRAAFLMGRIL